MKLDFVPLQKSHFPLLLKWLETPHVKAWWDQDISWTPKLIEAKFSSYVEGYKLEGGALKKMDAFIIRFEQKPMGYIQFYNAYDFPRDSLLEGLPESLGAFDMLIGEKGYVGRGIGSRALNLFITNYGALQYTHFFADPDAQNKAAIGCYEKAGFKKVGHPRRKTSEVWMLFSPSEKDSLHPMRDRD